MAKIIIIETSGATCSVALADGGKLIEEISDNKGSGTATASSEHSSLLAPFIEELIKRHGSVDAVAVSYGPGSYTGLRIGLSTAKGICYGKNIPMILIDSLRLLTEEVLANHSGAAKDKTLYAMVDARRMEVFCAKYDSKGNQIADIEAVIVGDTTFENIDNLALYGSGAKKCAEILEKCGKQFEILEIEPSAKSLVSYAEKMYQNGAFADIAYAEPLYIKQWQPTTVKKAK